MNKKVLSFFVLGILVMSLVSANWFTEIFRGQPNPNSKAGVSYSPSNFGLADLAQGVQLKSGWNYWYTWTDTKSVSIQDATANLKNLKSISAYKIVDGKNVNQGNWYPGKTTNTYNLFQQGWMYALSMSQAEVWKYNEVTQSTGGSSGSSSGGSGSSNNNLECYTKAEIDAKLNPLKVTGLNATSINTTSLSTKFVAIKDGAIFLAYSDMDYSAVINPQYAWFDEGSGVDTMVNSREIQIRNSTSNTIAKYNSKGVQMQSPDKTTWCCKPDNNGVFACSKDLSSCK